MRFLKGLLLIAIVPFALGGAASYVAEAFTGAAPPKPKTTPAPAPTPTSSSKVDAKPGSKDSQAKKVTPQPGRQYEVQPGDTISKISEANGVDYLELAKYNNIPYPYNLTVGQTIIIPDR